MHFLNMLRHTKNTFERIFIRPKYPEIEKRLIHLGCGTINDPNFINVDSRYGRHIHHVTDVTHLDQFSDNFADLIYACHVLEHVGFRELENVLLEWKRVLKAGGKLRLSVPDFQKLLVIYYKNSCDINCIVPMLMGGQDYPENQHRSIFNRAYLESLLVNTGFTDIREWNPINIDHHGFEDWSSKTIDIGDKCYPISLNIESAKK